MRRYAGHEQAAFAELLGTSRRTVSRIESGVKVPTRAELVSWSFATGVDLQRRYWVLRLAEACEVGPGEVTGDDLAAWLAGTDWSPNTRCSARASVRAFYRWAQQTGRREDNPTDALLTIAATPGRPRPCPESALLTAVRAAGDRERLMLALGACAGLRRAVGRPCWATEPQATSARGESANL